VGPRSCRQRRPGNRLWRGAKGYERHARGICVPRALHGAKTSEASCKAKAIEGVEKPIRPLAPLRYTLKAKPTPGEEGGFR